MNISALIEFAKAPAPEGYDILREVIFSDDESNRIYKTIRGTNLDCLVRIAIAGNDLLEKEDKYLATPPFNKQDIEAISTAFCILFKHLTLKTPQPIGDNANEIISGAINACYLI
ncbi:MAG TPA: hypothetical protein PLK94_02365 [Alphaproteobacteria bacterium]|nr:hypothetical protein [Alphaproteobacteria bacterium]HOO50111.1 hypothetical protein [Alphaproteobacteria bacterium]